MLKGNSCAIASGVRFTSRRDAYDASSTNANTELNIENPP